MKQTSLLLGLLLGTQSLFGAAVPSPDKLLPKDTVAVWTIPDSAKNRAVSSKAAWSQLWSSPVMKEFSDKFSAKWTANVIRPLEKELGIEFKNYQDLAQGQTTFALTLEEGAGTPTGGLLILIDSRDQKGRLTEQLA